MHSHINLVLKKVPMRHIDGNPEPPPTLLQCALFHQCLFAIPHREVQCTNGSYWHDGQSFWSRCHRISSLFVCTIFLHLTKPIQSFRLGPSAGMMPTPGQLCQDTRGWLAWSRPTTRLDTRFIAMLADSTTSPVVDGLPS